jgi:enamine deaminase RidA (YjgF/YER057c/UK114 family)
MSKRRDTLRDPRPGARSDTQIDVPAAPAAGPLLSPVVVAAWPTPRGYANGIIGIGRILHVAGQIGWHPDGRFDSDDLIEQFAIALDNVLAVVNAAGGDPESIAAMTVYVTEIETYRARQRELGPIWNTRLGRHYPAMALVAVTALVEPRAKVEIVAVAHLPALAG